MRGRSRYTLRDDRFDLGVVKHARRFIVEYLKVNRVEEAERVRAWILGQLRHGRPVQSIEFRDCHERSTKPLFDELVHLQAAQSITWCGGELGNIESPRRGVARMTTRRIHVS
jgi:hypothetical protein